MRWSKYLDIDEALGTLGLVRESRTGGAGSFFFGLTMGLVAGGAAALLLTPFRGTEAREKLTKASGDIGRQLSQRVNQLKAGSSNGSQQQQGQTGYAQGTRVGSSY